MIDTNLIVVIVLLITLLVGFFSYSFISNKFKLRKLKEEKEELKQLTNKTLAIFLARIIIIIEKNNDLVDNFVVGNKLKMSDVNNVAKTHLQSLQKDPIVAQILKSGYETERIFFDNLALLANSKSNLWKKRNAVEIKYFSDFAIYLKDFDKTILVFFNEEKNQFLKYYHSLIIDLKKGNLKNEEIIKLCDNYLETHRVPLNIKKLPFWKKWKKR